MMDNAIQLVSFLVSFLYGMFIYFTSLLNYKIILNKNIYFKYLISICYTVVISLLYVIIMYKINEGVIHIYFVITILLGFILSFKCLKSVKYYLTSLIKKF